jgi:hypothetical protein
VNPREALLPITCCVLAAWLGYVAGARGDASPASASSPKTASSPRAEPTTAAKTPSPETPGAPRKLATEFADLAQRANDGDGDAAKQLARDLGRCAHTYVLESTVRLTEAAITHRAVSPSIRIESNEGSDRARERLEHFRDELASAQALCDGVTRDQVKSRAHWLYLAGLAGDAESALTYGTGAFIYDDLLGQLEQIPPWRGRAEGMLQRALEGGEERALLSLARGHDPAREANDAGEPSFAPDPVAAYAYYTAMSLLSGWQRNVGEDNAARLDPELTDAERAQALAMAADICLNDLPTICSLPPSASSSP